MEPTPREATGLPLTGGFAVVVAVLITFFAVKLPPLQGSRPLLTSPVKQHVSGTEEVSARLWQDPFHAVYESVRPVDAALGQVLPLKPLSGLHAEIEKLVQNNEPVTLLGVMTFGGPYPENAERRLRSRYAVVSALGTRGYIPDDPNHIGFVTSCLPVSDGDAVLADKGVVTCRRKGMLVPYEWYRAADRSSSLVVLWLDDDALQRTPLDYLSGILGGIADDLEVHKAVIGPAGSTNLRFMLEQLDQAFDAGASDWGALKEATILSSSATAARFLDWEHVAAPVVSELQGEPAECEDIQDCFAEHDIRFRRSIPTDRTVMKELVHELRLRGVDPIDDHIAVISEWDTDYGRSLPETFCAAIKAGRDSTSTESPRQSSSDGCGLKNIERYSYLRGLDGRTSGKAGDSAQAQRQTSSDDAAAVERPVGRAQTDYLRRLGERLADRNAELQRMGVRRGIRAIGVLGSDVYDKMMVLQALRDRFPGALFFTTDMDVSFLHPQDYTWTRNLIVASGYGLALEPALQQRIAPFRDVYQTSLYLSTLLATMPRPLDQSEIECLARPKIIEVARFEPHVYKLGDSPARCDHEGILEKVLGRHHEAAIGGTMPAAAAGGRFSYEYSTFVRRSSYIIGFSLLFLYLALRFFDQNPPRLTTAAFYFKELLPALFATGIVVSAGAVPMKLQIGPVAHFAVFATALFLIVSLIYAWHCHRVSVSSSGAAFRPVVRGVVRNFALPSFTAGLIGATLYFLGTHPDEQRGAQAFLFFVVSVVVLVYLLYRVAATETPRDPGVWRNVWLLGFGGSLFAAVATLIAAQSGSGEPMSFLSGISIWPGELLRVAGGLLSLYFIVHAVRSLADNRQLINDTFCSGDARPGHLSGTLLEWWCDYAAGEHAAERIRRASLLALIFFLITGSIVQITPPLVPFRGEIAFWVDKYVILGFSVPLLLILTMFVLDATKRFSVLVERLRGYLSSEGLKEDPETVEATPDTIREIIQLIALRSDALAPLVIYPVIVILVMALSRSSYFDKWDFPVPLYVVIGLTSIYPLYSALRVRRSAERARQAALFALQQQLRTAYHCEQSPPRDGSEGTSDTRGSAEAASRSDMTSKEIRMVITQVEGIRQGAFRPYSQQPWLQGLILFFGGSGSLLLLEYFVWVR